MNNQIVCVRFGLWRLLAAVALCCWATPAARAAVIEFDLRGTAGAGLLPGNEPGAITGGTGGEIGAGIFYDDATKELTVNVGWGSSQGFTDLSSAANNSHIHGPTGNNFGNDGTGSFRQTGGVAFGLSRSSDAATGGIITPNVFTLTPEQETNLFNGKYYINIHTVNNAGGELRGFLVPATPVLAIDFNDRSFLLATNTPNGFDSFLLGAVGTSTLIQTAATVRAFGPYTVTVAGAGTNPGYDDRLRGTPTNSPTLTQGQLYRDFVFSSDTGSGGLNVTVAGLTPDQAYRVTCWSFDQGSANNRVSDWSANGTLVVDNYTFNGSTLPTTDNQNTFTFKVSASPSGQIALQGRRDASSVAGNAVFLNALLIEITTPDAPVITAAPAPVTVYAGDNASFTAAVGGTAPFALEWRKDGNPIPGATNATFALTNCQPGDAADYTLVATNISGSATSAPAALVVLPVTQLASGMLAYWPLDTLTDITPDVSGGNQHLNATNLDSSNLIAGRRGNAIFFNGNDEFLTRTNGPGDLLPAYAYPAYTVMMWVKGYFTNQLDRRVWCESSNTNNNPLMTLGTDAAGTNGNVDVFVRNNNGSAPHNHRKSTVTNAFDGNWHHIAWVDNNGAGKLYVDGVPDATDFSYARGVLTPNITTLGAVYRTTNIAHFNGAIDDAAVWRRALSQAEIQRFLAAGTGPATLVVTSAADDGGPGTLRSVIAGAVSGDTVTFTNTLSGQTIVLTSGQIVLDKNLTIDGSALPGGIAIDANNASRIFQSASGTTNVLLNLLLTGGNGVGALESGNGGAIYNEGSLALIACTVAGNSGIGGGGILSQDSVSQLVLTNCTLAGNTAGFGGALLLRNSSTVSLVHCTVSGNTGTGGSGGVVLESSATLALHHTIVAGNPDNIGGEDIGGCGGTLTRSGNNVIGTQPFCYPAVAPIGAPNANGDYVGTSASPVLALLAPLARYGGPTPTLPPLSGSPAIDGCTGGGSLTTDQRGSLRPLGALADIGAVEGVFNPIFPLINPAVLGNGAFQFAFSNLPGAGFTVFGSTNVALPFNQWSNLGPAVEMPPASGQFQFIDPQATNSTERFYRVRLP